MQITCRSVTGHKLWCHGIQAHIPADFETLDLHERDVTFLREWASCEVEGVEGPVSVLAGPVEPVEEPRDPTIAEFVEAGGEPGGYPADGCEKVHSPALEAFWVGNWPVKIVDKEKAEDEPDPKSDAKPETAGRRRRRHAVVAKK